MVRLRIAVASAVVVISVAVAGAGVTVDGLVEVARDEGANYGDAWLGNGGFGFDTWVQRWTNAAPVGGYAGFYLSGTNDIYLENVGSEDGNKAWGLYANGTNSPGLQAAAAFRGFGWNGREWVNALDSPGDTFRISMESGDVSLGGGIGFALRHANDDFEPDDVTNNARFAFAFIGAFYANYQIVLGTNESDLIDTGVGHRYTGLNLEFELTSRDTFSFRIYDPAASNRLMTNIVGDLASAGAIDSVALFNTNSLTAELNDVYFNFMSIEQYIPPTVIVVR